MTFRSKSQRLGLQAGRRNESKASDMGSVERIPGGVATRNWFLLEERLNHGWTQIDTESRERTDRKEKTKVSVFFALRYVRIGHFHEEFDHGWATDKNMDLGVCFLSV